MDVGHIVKFKNLDGTLNGGTIVGFKKNQNGSDQALINTLDGKKVLVDLTSLIMIKHQIRGKQSKKFLDKVRSEIEIHNTGAQANPSVKRHKEELQLWINKYNEAQKEVNSLKSDKQRLTEENDNLIEKIREKSEVFSSLQEEFTTFKQKHESKIDRDRVLSYTILGLREAMVLGAAKEYEEQISKLLDIIVDVLEVNN